MLIPTQGRVNIDNTFYIPFTDQVDLRDSRPMAYAGRIVLPETLDVKSFAFRNCPLMRLRRTEHVTQVASKDMITIEDLSPTALPTSTDDQAAVVQGAHKYIRENGVFNCELFTGN